MNKLKHIAEFRSVLEHYSLSAAAKKTLAQTPAVLMCGPTSSGRNSIINELLKSSSYYYIISDTTRQKRIKDGVPIEENGREYWFRSEEEVLNELKRGEFLEAAIIHEQQISGISIREITKAYQTKRIAITDIEPNGVETIHRLKPDAVTIFVIPPDFESWINRFYARSDMPADEIHRRLKTACQEIDAALSRSYFSFVVNDKLEAAVHKVDAIIQNGQTNPDEQQVACQLALKLRQDTEAYLRREKL